MNQKIQKLREKLNSQNIQGMIISNPVNIRYLINVEAEGVLLLTRKENIYITDARYIEDVNSCLTIEDEIIISDVRSLDLDDYENFFMFCENVGFEEKYVTYERYKKILEMYKCNNLIETEGIIEKLRIIKNEEEIEYIKKACKITDDCFEHLKKYIKKGMTEIEVALEIERFFIKNGAEGVAFDPIVATGENSSKPHAVPTERKIQSNDIILIDIGCKYNGYTSDMTRTLFMDTIPDKAKTIYDMVLKNQDIVLRELREGRAVKDIAKISECDFDLKGYSPLHALGHGVGLETHEVPIISTRCNYLLKENMVLAIEPGAYIYSKLGIRIEDTVLITKDGCINLTNFGKNYTII